MALLWLAAAVLWAAEARPDAVLAAGTRFEEPSFRSLSLPRFPSAPRAPAGGLRDGAASSPGWRPAAPAVEPAPVIHAEAERLYFTAVAHYRRGRLAEAKRLVFEVLKRRPGHEGALRLASKLAAADPR